jgi:oligoribonuclease NrnB/cAMP/cGMP phosphodiesterase (DHH superfamily)
MHVLVILHADCADATAAGWCTDLYFNHKNSKELFPQAPTVEYYSAPFYVPPPFDKIEKADRTYILDFSYSREDLIKVSKMTDLLVLDHHKSAEAQCHGLDFCQFDMERSGAGMTWDHFFPDDPRPWFIDYIEDRDLWKWKLPTAEPILAYLDTLPVSFDTYDRLASGDVTFGQCLESGTAILAYINQYNKEVAAMGVRYITFQSPSGRIHFDIPIVNAAYKGISQLLHEISQDHPFALGWYRRKDGKYKFSARASDKSAFDTSKFAKEYGGGGHVKASGFTLDHEIEELPPEGAGKS